MYWTPLSIFWEKVTWSFTVWSILTGDIKSLLATAGQKKASALEPKSAQMECALPTAIWMSRITTHTFLVCIFSRCIDCGKESWRGRQSTKGRWNKKTLGPVDCIHVSWTETLDDIGLNLLLLHMNRTWRQQCTQNQPIECHHWVPFQILSSSIKPWIIG